MQNFIDGCKQASVAVWEVVGLLGGVVLALGCSIVLIGFAVLAYHIMTSKSTDPSVLQAMRESTLEREGADCRQKMNGTPFVTSTGSYGGCLLPTKP